MWKARERCGFGGDGRVTLLQQFSAEAVVAVCTWNGSGAMERFATKRRNAAEPSYDCFV